MTNSLANIAESNLENVLSNTDANYMMSVTGEIQRSFHAQKKWRSNFIANNAILDNEKYPLPSSKYWQAVREELVMFEQLCNQSLDYERHLLEKEMLEINLEDVRNPESKKGKVIKKLIGLDILAVELKIIHVKHDCKNRVREIRIWEDVKNKIVKENPELDIDSPESSQEEHWVARWSNDIRAGNDMMSPVIYRHAKTHLNTWKDKLDNATSKKKLDQDSLANTRKKLENKKKTKTKRK